MSLQTRVTSGLQAMVRGGLQAIADAETVVESAWYLSKVDVDSPCDDAELAAELTPSATLIVLTSGGAAELLPDSSTPYFAKIYDNLGFEVVRVTAVVGDTLTVERGREGTSAITWPAGTAIRLRFDFPATFKEPLSTLETTPNGTGPVVIWADDEIVLLSNRTWVNLGDIYPPLGSQYEQEFHLYCHEADSGELIWQETFPHKIIGTDGNALLTTGRQRFLVASRNGASIAISLQGTVRESAEDPLQLQIDIAIFSVADGTISWSTQARSYVASVAGAASTTPDTGNVPSVRIMWPRCPIFLSDSGVTFAAGVRSKEIGGSTIQEIILFQAAIADGSLSHTTFPVSSSASGFAVASNVVPICFFPNGTLIASAGYGDTAFSRIDYWCFVAESLTQSEMDPTKPNYPGTNDYASYDSGVYVYGRAGSNDVLRRYNSSMVEQALSPAIRAYSFSNFDLNIQPIIANTDIHEATVSVFGGSPRRGMRPHAFGSELPQAIFLNIDESGDVTLAVSTGNTRIAEGRNAYYITPDYDQIRTADT